jgi:hypothetical protein
MADVPGFVRAKVAEMFEEREQERSLWPVPPETRSRVEIFVLECLLEFMGPGADELFLDFYVLEGGHLFGRNDACANMGLVVLPAQSYMVSDKLAKDREDYLKERRRENLYSMANDIVYRKKIKTQDVLQGFRRPADSEYYSDAFVQALIRYMGPESEDTQDLLASQRMAVLGPVPCPDHHGDMAQVFVTICPYASYRKAIMGELAAPWTELPPPYGPYVPRRRS